MRRLRLLLEYDGTDFAGWQWQPTGERTIQGALQNAFAQLPGEHGNVHAAGRTDAGVHALAMVAHVDSTSTLADEKLRMALAAHLPRDIAVQSVVTTAPDFEAQFHCLYRRYLYRLRIVRGDARGLALDRQRFTPVFRHLNVAAMQEAASAFVGEHDFSTFATQEQRTPVRTLYLSELRVEAGELRFHVAGNGFLRHMVRAMVGTLLWVGKGKLAASDMAEILAAKDRTRAGQNVGPQGLYFAEAGYEAWDRARSEVWVAERAPAPWPSRLPE